MKESKLIAAVRIDCGLSTACDLSRHVITTHHCEFKASFLCFFKDAFLLLSHYMEVFVINGATGE